MVSDDDECAHVSVLTSVVKTEPQALSEHVRLVEVQLPEVMVCILQLFSE